MADALDLYKGQVWVAPDFDAPLPEDVLADFEGRDADHAHLALGADRLVSDPDLAA